MVLSLLGEIKLKNVVMMCVWLLFSHHILFTKQVGSTVNVSKQSRTFFSNDGANEMTGFSIFTKGFVLQDVDTIVNFNAYFPISGDVVLNKGTINLQTDLTLQSPMTIGGGMIKGNYFNISFPHNIEQVIIPSAGLDHSLVQLLEKSYAKRIFSLDWSYDGKYLALGFDSSNSIYEIQVYELIDNDLILKASQNYNNNDDVRALAWHPSSYYLAAGSLSNNELRVWLFDPNVPSITESDNANINDVYALAWSHDGNYLAAGRSNTSDVYLYSFSSGTLGSLIKGSLGSKGHVYDVSWDSTDSYLVVGQRRSSGKELHLFSFNGSTLTKEFDSELNKDVYGAQWHPSLPYVAVGCRSSTNQFRLYSFANGALAQTSQNLEENDYIYSLDWSKDGNYLAVGKDSDPEGLELEVYYFNQDEGTLHLSSGIVHAQDIWKVKWHPSGNYLAVSDTTGKLYLYTFEDQDLHLENVKINCGTQTQFTRPLIFNGKSTITGNGLTIDLASTSSIMVASGSQLRIEDAIIKGVKNRAIACEDGTSTLVLSNVTLLLDGYTSFEKGAIRFENTVKFKGEHIFAYHTSQTSTILSEATVKLDQGFTFSYDVPSGNQNCFQFQDYSARLILNGATMRTTATGMQLTSGQVIIKKDSTLYAERYNLPDDDVFGGEILDNGFIVGNDTYGQDLQVAILSGVNLDVKHGTLHLNNYASGNINLLNPLSSITMHEQTSLKISTDTVMPLGKIFFKALSRLGTKKTVDFQASIVPQARMFRYKYN